VAATAKVIGSHDTSAGDVPAEQRVGRAAALGALIGFVVAVIGVTAAGTAGGLGAGASFGLSVFVGLWGGLGFGFMGAASVSLARYGDQPDAHVVHRAATARAEPSPSASDG
jgi:hypothetical protein